MKNRTLHMTLSIALPALAATGLQANAATDRPNVILCMADDLGWGDVGYNGNTIIRTPNLDQMARDGVRFDRFYSAAPVCSPTRASCLTGRHPYRTGVFTANAGILRPEETTLAEVLKAQGYRTGHFGKWHLGTFRSDTKDGNRGGQADFVNPPDRHGFESYFSTESKVPTWDPMKMPAKFEKGESEYYWSALEEGRNWKPFGTAYWSPQGLVSENLDGDDSRIIMDRAIPFIQDAVAQGKPFFAVIWFHAPHLPCVAGPEYAAMYKEQSFEMRQFAGCVTAMDEQMGRLRTELDRLGVAGNTLITFCSDNGPEGSETAPGKTGGFKGRKRSLHDGGVRVPGLAVWPGRIKPMVTALPAVTSDYMPTVLDILGLPPATALHPLDGVSLWPLLKGEPFARPGPIAFVSGSQIALNGETWKLYRGKPSDPPELYNMPTDPYETRNLAAEQSGPADSLLKQFTSWYAGCRDSFDGKDYGETSGRFLEQIWPETPVGTSGAH